MTHSGPNPEPGGTRTRRTFEVWWKKPTTGGWLKAFSRPTAREAVLVGIDVDDVRLHPLVDLADVCGVFHEKIGQFRYMDKSVAVNADDEERIGDRSAARDTIMDRHRRTVHGHAW